MADYRIEGNDAFIALTRGYEAVIDLADLPLVAGRKWQASIEPHGTVYAICSYTLNGRQTTVRMHRLILGASEGADVDHRDCDGLNNRRSNLRHASRSQNRANARIGARNTSGYKGVRIRRGKWRAEIRKDGKSHCLGTFLDPVSAHKAYIEAAQTLFGEFARSS
jgi:hypothetical protein